MARFLEEEEDSSSVARRSGQRVCYKHERAIPIQQTVESLDIREEGEGWGIGPEQGRWRSQRGSGSLRNSPLSSLAGIETLLCYLELHPQHWLELLPHTYSSCRLLCYRGPQQLRTVARRLEPHHGASVSTPRHSLC